MEKQYKAEYQTLAKAKVKRSALLGLAAILAVSSFGATLNADTPRQETAAVSPLVNVERPEQTVTDEAGAEAEGKQDTVKLDNVETIGFSLPCLEWRGWSWRTGTKWGVKYVCALSLGGDIGKAIYSRYVGPWIDRCWPNCEFTLW